MLLRVVCVVQIPNLDVFAFCVLVLVLEALYYYYPAAVVLYSLCAADLAACQADRSRLLHAYDLYENQRAGTVASAVSLW